jgi:hypothetical protein
MHVTPNDYKDHTPHPPRQVKAYAAGEKKRREKLLEGGKKIAFEAKQKKQRDVS